MYIYVYIYIYILYKLLETFPQDFFLEHVIDVKGDGPIDGPNDRVQKQ